MFTVVVPKSQMERARECLYGTPPAGVRYPWNTPDAMRVGATFGATPVPGAPQLSDNARANPALSDNDRLQRLAGGGFSMGAALALIGGFLALLAVLWMLMRP